MVEAIKTGGDVDKAAANLEFLVNTGLVTDKQRANQIRHYIAVNRLNPERLPSLPSVGQTPPSVARKALPASAPVFVAARQSALKVTNRASAICPGRSCRAGTRAIAWRMTCWSIRQARPWRSPTQPITGIGWGRRSL